MKQDDKWLDALRENLNDYHVTPSDALWKRIEDDLSASSHKTARIVPLWIKTAAAAAVVALIGGGSWMYFSRSLGESAQKMVADNSTAPKTYVAKRKGSDTKLTENITTPTGVGIQQKHHSLLAARKTSNSYTTEDSDMPLATAVATSSEEVANTFSADTTTADKPMLAVVSATTDDETSDDKRSNTSDESTEKDAGSQANEKPRNWYDAVPDNAHASMAQSSTADKRQRWSLALTAMNGLPSVGGNTGSGNVMLSAMSNASSSLRPFGGSLADEFVNGSQPSLLEKTPKQESTTSVKHKIPVSYGASFRYNLTNKWGVETGLSYTLLSSTFSNETDHSSYDQNLRYLEVPVRVSYTFVNQRWIAIYAATGGAVAKCISAKMDGTNNDDYSISVKPWQFSISTSAGVQLNILEHFGIYVEPGLGYYFKDNSDLRTVYKDHPWSFKLNMGIRVSY